MLGESFSGVGDDIAGTEGLDVWPFSIGRDGVASPLTLRTPFGIGPSNPGLGDDSRSLEGVPKGWKPFILSAGSSSIRRFGFRRV